MNNNPYFIEYMIRERIKDLHAEAHRARTVKAAGPGRPGWWTRICFGLGKWLASMGRNLQRRYHPQMSPGSCLTVGK